MSRYHPDYSIEPILQAVATWKQQALGPQRSLFSNTVASWTTACFEELHRSFVEKPDFSENSFWDKLEGQLSEVSAAAKLLMSEIVWLLLLFPSSRSWKESTKRERIERVYHWASLGQTISPVLLSDEVLRGVGNCGQAYKTGFWREVSYAIRLFKALLAKPQDYRATLLADGWSWGEWQVEMPESEKRQFRHMISFLLFPDEYESYASLNEKQRILSAFKKMSESELKGMKLVALDQHLYQLRQELQTHYGTPELVFYREPLLSRWRLGTDKPRYWAGGFQWDEVSMHDEFISNNYWRIGHDRATKDPSGHTAWQRFEQIREGDYFIIKGYSPRHKSLKCHYYGRVVEVDDEKNVMLSPLDTAFKYHGEPPTGVGAGNWSDTLLEITRQSDIDRLFGRQPTVGEGGMIIDDSDTEMIAKARNIILYGPPGTGKTHALRTKWMPQYQSIRGSASRRYEFVTFHQSYGYEEFIEGLRPLINEEGQISYEVHPGVFQRICNRAKLDPDNRYAIFIDEINRGNISKIFGELITLIEADKRVCYDREGKAVAGDTGMHTTLPYSGISFGVPANVDIIGTMNTADRSIALLDIALRRRFEFQELMPTSDAIEGADGRGTIENGTIDLRVLLAMLNRRIRLLAGRDLQLGHAFFCPVKNIVQLNHCFAHRILPLLQEYFYGHWERMQLVLGDQEAQLSTEQRRQRERCCFILSEELEEIAVLGFDHDDHDSKWDYFVNPCLLEGTLGAEAYTKIYQVNHADVAGS